MGIGYGFGKVILFGEHFVVYGLPGIVSAINSQSEVLVEKLPEHNKRFVLTDKSPKFPGVQELTFDVCKKTITRVLDFLKITVPVGITLQGDLKIPSSGLGSSAAILVGLARALSKEFGLGLTDEQINRTAFEGEKEVHGNPSGIDNTAATYGGIFWFEKREQEKNVVQNFEIKKPIEIVLVESGKDTIAKTAIEHLKNFKDKNTNKTAMIFDEYKKLVADGKLALLDYDLEKVGKLMNKNHELLCELELSCPELERVIKIARSTGALGAKLTGAGQGGLAVALTPGKELQEKVAIALKNAGYSVLKSSLG